MFGKILDFIRSLFARLFGGNAGSPPDDDAQEGEDQENWPGEVRDRTSLTLRVERSDGRPAIELRRGESRAAEMYLGEVVQLRDVTSGVPVGSAVVIDDGQPLVLTIDNALLRPVA